MEATKTAIFIGNSVFGDDGISLAIGDMLRSRLEGMGFDVHIVERTGFALLDYLEGYDHAVIVDSVAAVPDPEGSVRVFSSEEFRLVKPNTPHFAGVPEALQLMRSLQMKMPDVRIIGIKVNDPHTLSESLSTELNARTTEIGDRVYQEILEAEARMKRHGE